MFLSLKILIDTCIYQKEYINDLINILNNN